MRDLTENKWTLNVHIDVFHLLASGPEDSGNVGKQERHGRPEWV
jgi:hypothetical protein